MKIQKMMKLPIYFIAFLFVMAGLGSCSEIGKNLIYGNLLSNIVNSSAVEYGIAFTPSGDSCFFVRHEGRWGAKDNPPSSIFLTTFNTGSWSEPERAFFSQDSTDDYDVSIAPDGRTIYFVSNRDYPGKTGSGPDIWSIEKINGEWGQAAPMDNTINTADMEFSPVANRRGDLFFAAVRLEGLGQGDLYVARKQSDGSFTAPEPILEVSSEYGEWNVFVEPDEKWLIFESSGRPGSRSSNGDLYFSEKKDGIWQAPVPLSVINTPGSDLNVRLGPDGEFLYYACSYYEKGLNADILRIPINKVLQGS